MEDNAFPTTMEDGSTMSLLDSASKNHVGNDARSPLENLKSTIGNLNKLPMLPEAATQALALANDPRSSLNDFSGVIMRDPVLATGILQLANSPLYRIGRTIESVGQAVVRLGLRECKNLVIAVGMRSLFRTISPARKHQCETLWRHSLLTASLCRHLNRVLELGFRGEEFSCGLCHDLGRVIFAVGVPAHFEAADPMTFVEGPKVLAHEQDILGTDHCYFGAWFANLNQLPSSLVSAIQFHHAPMDATGHEGLVGLVSMADDIANHWQRERTGNGYDLATNPGWAFLASAFDEGLRLKMDSLLPALMDEAFQEADEASRLGAA